VTTVQGRVDSPRASAERLRILLCATPIHGHVRPLVDIGRGLASRGHAVTMLTGRKYRAAAEQNDLTWWPIPPEIDYDDADLDAWMPGRSTRRGIDAGCHDVINLFIRPIHGQHRALMAALRRQRFDAVVAEAAFLGTLPFLLTVPAAERLPVVGVSTTPLSVVSIDCAPFGSGMMPGHPSHTRLRNPISQAALRHGWLKPLYDSLDTALAPHGLPPRSLDYFDHVTAYDEAFHLTVPEMEYPRRELPARVHFVGPPHPAPTPDSALPSWWSDLDDRPAVVHVTQGTPDNHHLDKLVGPVLHALRDSDVLVVASTGGRPTAELLRDFGGRLPSNARAAEFLPYDRLLPSTAVMITNGGFGGVQQALAHGVPMVVAGATEDKKEVAARVAWSGTGINLRTGRPSARALRRAVQRILQDPQFSLRAGTLRQRTDELGDPVEAILQSLTSLVSRAIDADQSSAGSGSGHRPRNCQS
jgi:MGT family glycosyltransferase